MAIIGIMVALFVPGVDRALSQNRLAEDSDIFKSKIEQTRLLAGSTQTVDEPTSNPSPNYDETGFYAVYIPKSQGSANNYYALVRLNYIKDPAEGNGRSKWPDVAHDPNGQDCAPWRAIEQAQAGQGICLLEKIRYSTDIEAKSFTSQDELLIAFRIPNQELFRVWRDTDAWLADEPIFGQVLKLQYKNKTANINLESYTGRVDVTYQ